MPPTSTRVKKISESGKVDQRQKQIEGDHVERIKISAKTTGTRLKIMAPSQLITRLPILLAQIQAGNNSQKLNNEIRQIIYSLYRSKNISKTVYNHLINSI